jgi:hypothetical protein
MPKLKIDYNMAAAQADNVHGRHVKDQIILHETVSANYPGLGDIRSVSEYLDNKDYGMHGITDADGHVAWALGLGTAIFYHTLSSGSKGNGYANSRGIGIEQVSRVMVDYRTNAQRRKVWLGMHKEIDATAKLCACIARAHKIPIKTSDGTLPGITTHWLVTEAYGVPGGHTDCWPVNNGGYYPLSLVVQRTRYFYYRGWRF